MIRLPLGCFCISLLPSVKSADRQERPLVSVVEKSCRKTLTKGQLKETKYQGTSSHGSCTEAPRMCLRKDATRVENTVGFA